MFKDYNLYNMHELLAFNILLHIKTEPKVTRKRTSY